jgi:hypothetical protein
MDAAAAAADVPPLLPRELLVSLLTPVVAQTPSRQIGDKAATSARAMTGGRSRADAFDDIMLCFALCVHARR